MPECRHRSASCSGRLPALRAEAPAGVILDPHDLAVVVAHLAGQIDFNRCNVLAPGGVVNHPHDRAQQIVVMHGLNHRKMPAFQHDQRADRIDAHRTDKCGNQPGIELGSALIIELA